LSLYPRIGVDSSYAHPCALLLRDATLLAISKVEVADEDLVLACTADRAEPPSAGKVARSAPFGQGPREVGWTRVYQTKWVVARLVEADSNRVGRHPFLDVMISQSACNSVDEKLQSLLADLYFVSAIFHSVPQTHSAGDGKTNIERKRTDRVTLGVIIDEENGQFRIPPLVVGCCNDVPTLKSDGVSSEGT
jgi:hypothetical protein